MGLRSRWRRRRQTQMDNVSTSLVVDCADAESCEDVVARIWARGVPYDKAVRIADAVWEDGRGHSET